MKEYFGTWDRETTLMFMSMVVGAYAWVMTERIFIGVAVGLAMYAIEVIAYQFLASRLGWRDVEAALLFDQHIAPRISRLLSKTQRA
ncbi:MAG: hypothetical protein WAZ27_01060 [Minisyncoccia bacterium]